ncbi:hypothetical protein QJQ45_008359 [Haematococcus lacustris]|nr:hypothetical protein QJQ45_008359 [Haematococcus lacustris]
MARKKRRTGVGGPRAVPEDPDFNRDEAAQPDLTEAQRKRKASGEARAARSRDNTFHARKATLAHLIDHLPQALWDAFFDKAVRPRVKAISERGVIGSLLLGFLVRDLFTLHVADQLDAQGQPLSYTDTDIPVSAADIPDLSCRNLYLQLCRGLPGEGENTQPSAAVAAVLAAHPDLCARLEAIPRHLSDTNMVDQVGKQLETAFSNMLTLLFAGRLKKSVSLAGAKVLLGTNEHQRRFGFRPERVVLVDEFRTSRVSSADNTPSETLLDTPPESFRWLRPVKSMAKRSQVRGLMCLTSINNITRFYDRDVSAALNIRRCAVGPGPRPTELCYWTNRPAMPKPGQPGQEWVEIADKPLLRKWQRQLQQ